MFLPSRKPSKISKTLFRRKCFRYSLPASKLHPIAIAFDHPLDDDELIPFAHKHQHFNVHVYAENWDSELEQQIEKLMPSSIENLIDWIELARLEYEDSAEETVRERIDPAWFSRVRWDTLNLSTICPITRKLIIGCPKSQKLITEQTAQYDQFGFPAFLSLEHVYIDPAKKLLCLSFSALLDSHSTNHGFAIIRNPDGKIVHMIRDSFYHYAEHAKI